MHVKLPLPLRLIHGENNMKINLQILDSSLRYSDVPTYVSNDESTSLSQRRAAASGLQRPRGGQQLMFIIRSFAFLSEIRWKIDSPSGSVGSLKVYIEGSIQNELSGLPGGCDVTALSHAHSSIIKTHWFNLYNLRCRNNELCFLLGETDWNSFCLGSLSHQSRRECDNAFKQQMVRLENKEQDKYQPN